MSKNDIFDVSYETYQEQVISESFKRPVILDMWADWCPPCIIIAPVLEEIVRESNGQLALAKLEVDEGENMKIAGQYHVRGFPTIILIQNGEEKARFSSARSKQYVLDFVADNIQK